IELDEAGEPPAPVANELTSALKLAVESIVPTAQNASDLVLAEIAERILSAAIRDTPEQCPNTQSLLSASETEGKRLTLSERMARRRHLLDAYNVLEERFPQALLALIREIRALSDKLEASGLPIDAEVSTPVDFRKRRPFLLLMLFLLAPFALVGALIHSPAYFLVRFLAFRFSKVETDITATVKVLAGLLFFPLTWIALGALCSWAL